MDDSSEKRRPGFWDGLGRFLAGRKKITEEEIQELIDAGEEEGIINQEENEMIRSIFELRDTVVREIMVPRTDMACIPADAPVRQVISAIIGCGHSRIPVYDGTIDNVIGILYAKDLLKHWGVKDESINLRRIIRPAFFIPETKSLEVLLQEFKRKRVHLAVVIDEYGGTSGIVTIEDLLEQIVGDIQDEYDLEEEWLMEKDATTIVVDARLPIEELEGHFGIEIERDKFDTVGGLIIHLSGTIPVAGDEVETEELHITVMEADERRVIKARVTRKSEATVES